MQLTVLTICNDWRTNKNTVKNKWKVKGDTEEDCFKKAYPTERKYRYCCNDCGWMSTNIRFENPEVHQRYLNWKQYGVTIEMYYGNSTVD